MRISYHKPTSNHMRMYIVTYEYSTYHIRVCIWFNYTHMVWQLIPYGYCIWLIDWACENVACGLKYTMWSDEKYLNTEM